MMRKKLPADRAVGAQKSMEKPQWRATALALAAAVLLGVSASDASALALGRVTVQSALGEPLRADIDVPEINAEEAGQPARRRCLARRFSRRRPRVQPGAQRHPDHAAAPPGRPLLPAPVEPARRQRSLRRPDPGDQLVLRAHRARLHDAVRPAEPAPGPRRSRRRWRRSPPQRSARPRRPRPRRRRRRCPLPAPAAAVGRSAPRPRQPPQPPRQPAAATASRSPCKAGDTAGKIAAANKPASVSLDQMLVAMLRANPDAFIGGNVNRLKAGRGARYAHAPSKPGSVPPARPARPSSRRAATSTNSAAAWPKAARHRIGAGRRQASGKVQAQVEEKKPAAAAPDKLTLVQGRGARQGQPRTRSPASARPRTPPPAWRS